MLTNCGPLHAELEISLARDLGLDRSTGSRTVTRPGSNTAIDQGSDTTSRAHSPALHLIRCVRPTSP
jgi:hypothetical protein